MFSKPTISSNQNDPDLQPQLVSDRIRPANIETLPTFEPPTLVNGSVIGSDLTILGENINIVSKEALQIDGEIHGDVSGKKINIGVGGLVVGTISAQSVEIDGGVRGTVRAQEVQLNAEAKVSGELIHQTLIVSEGAEFEGSVRRPRDASELKPNLDIASPRPAAEPKSPEISPDFYAEQALSEPLAAPLVEAKSSRSAFSQ